MKKQSSIATMFGKFLFIIFYVIGYTCLAFAVLSLIHQQFIGILVFGIPVIISFGIVSWLRKSDTNGSIDNLESIDLLGYFKRKKYKIWKNIPSASKKNNPTMSKIFDTFCSFSIATRVYLILTLGFLAFFLFYYFVYGL